MFITGVGTAVPERRYTQREVWETLRASPLCAGLRPRSRRILEKVLTGESGIEARRLALDRLTDGCAQQADVLHARFARHAPALATAAGRAALSAAGLAPGEVDALLVSTCTGYLCPGLSSYVSETLGLRHDAQLLDLVGQGCGAALPNLRVADSLLAAGHCAQVLSVCVEVCSAAFYLDDDPGVLISLCLFGDGAAAVVTSGEARPGGRRMKWLEAVSLLDPSVRDQLRFEQREGKLRNVLAREVPELAARHARAVLDGALKSREMEPGQIATWLLHAGGRDVLLALRDALALSEPDLRWSAGVLREFGNLSSPSVLFALEAALRGGAPGGWWWMTSFGAGFSCHGALLEVK